MQEIQIHEKIQKQWNFPISPRSKVLFIGMHPIFSSLILEGKDLQVFVYEPDQKILSLFEQNHFILEKDDLAKFIEQFSPFDVIVFSTKIPKKEEIQVTIKELQEFQHLKAQEKTNYQKAKTILKNLDTMKYQDEDLEKFLSSIPEDQQSFIPQFLQTLLNQNQISLKQFEKYQFKNKEISQIEPIRFDAKSCIDCVKNYLSKKGMFIGFIEEAFSLYNEPLFLEEILTDPDYIVEEKILPKEFTQFFASFGEGLPKCVVIKKGGAS
jgi:hypothetical protein